MADVIMKLRSKDWEHKKLFATIEDLSYTYYARIIFSKEIVNISFYHRPSLEFVCKWKFDRYYFNEELKSLFHKHNSSIIEGRKEQ